MPPSRGSLLTRRTVATGSLLGVGLIASAATAPVALATGDEAQPSSSVADDGTTASTTVLNTTTTPTVPDGPAVTPFFGEGKQVTVTVAPEAGTAPSDLDLSGAVLDLVAPGTTAPIASCTTTSNGSCSFFDSAGFAAYDRPSPVETSSMASAPLGSYEVREATPAAGLAHVPGVLGSVALDNWFPASRTVTAASLFRTTVKATVSTADTPPQLVPAATYDLDGTPYPRRPGSPVDPSTALPRTGTSDANGVITYSGWFAPGNYTLTAQGATTPAKAFAVAAQVGRPPADVLVDLTVAATATPLGTASSEDSTPPAAPTTTSAAAAPTTAATPRTHSAPAPAAPPAPRAAAAAAATSAVPAPSPATLEPGNSLPQQDRASADQPQPVALPAAAPALETRSQSFPYGSVLAFGGPFVAAVVAAVVLILRRRRARYEYDA